MPEFNEIIFRAEFDPANIKAEIQKIQKAIQALQVKINASVNKASLAKAKAQIKRELKGLNDYEIKLKQPKSLKISLDKTEILADIKEIKNKLEALERVKISIKVPDIDLSGVDKSYTSLQNKLLSSTDRFAQQFEKSLKAAFKQLNKIELEVGNITVPKLKLPKATKKDLLSEASSKRAVLSAAESKKMASGIDNLVKTMRRMVNRFDLEIRQVKQLLKSIADCCRAQNVNLKAVNSSNKPIIIPSPRNPGRARNTNNSDVTRRATNIPNSLKQARNFADRIAASESANTDLGVASIETQLIRLRRALGILEDIDVPTEETREFISELKQLESLFQSASTKTRVKKLDRTERQIGGDIDRIKGDIEVGRPIKADIVEKNLLKVERAIESLANIKLPTRKLNEYRERLQGQKTFLKGAKSNVKSGQQGFSFRSFIGESTIDAVEALNNELGNTLRIVARLYDGLKQGDGLLKNLSKFKAPLGLLAAATTFGIVVANGAQAVIAIQKLEQTLNALNLSKVGEAVENAKRIALESGVDITQVARQSSKFSAATRDTSLENESQRIFESVVDYGVAIGATSDEIGRGLVALEQIAAKGRVSLEELNGQLSEALPGASNIAATALGISRKELFAMAEAGDLLAKDLLPAMATSFENIQAASAGNEVQILSREFNKLNQQLKLASAEIANTPVELLTSALGNLNDLLGESTAGAQNLAIAIKALIIAMAGMAVASLASGKAIGFFGAAFAKLGVALAASAPQIALFVGAVLAIGAALKAISVPPDIKLKIEGLESTKKKLQAIIDQFDEIDKRKKGGNEENGESKTPGLFTSIVRKAVENAKVTTSVLTDRSTSVKDARAKAISERPENIVKTRTNEVNDAVEKALQQLTNALDDTQGIEKLNAKIRESRRASTIIGGATAILDDPSQQDPLNNPLVQEVLLEYNVKAETINQAKDQLNNQLKDIRLEQNAIQLDVFPGGVQQFDAILQQAEERFQAALAQKDTSTEAYAEYKIAEKVLGRVRSAQARYNKEVEKTLNLNQSLGKELDQVELSSTTRGSEIELNNQFRIQSALKEAKENDFKDTVSLDAKLNEINRQNLREKANDYQKYYDDLNNLRNKFSEEELEKVRLQTGTDDFSKLSIPQLNELEKTSGTDTVSKVFSKIKEARLSLSDSIEAANQLFEADRQQAEELKAAKEEQNNLERQIADSRSNLLKSFSSSLSSLTRIFEDLALETKRLEAENKTKQEQLAILKGRTNSDDDISTSISDLLSQITDDIEANTLGQLDLEQEEVSIQRQFEDGVEQLRNAFNDYLDEFREFQKQLASLSQANQSRSIGSNPTSTGGNTFPIPGQTLGSARITSGFGNRRIFGRNDFHEGIDVAAKGGTDVVAARSGVVKYIKPLADQMQVGVESFNAAGQKVTEWFIHLDKNLDVKVGQQVQSGQKIGEVAHTTAFARQQRVSTGDHLDYRIKINGKWVNPKKALQTDIPITNISNNRSSNVTPVSAVPSSVAPSNMKEVTNLLKKVANRELDAKDTRLGNLELKKEGTEVDKDIRQEKLRLQSEAISNLFSESQKETNDTLANLMKEVSPESKESAVDEATGGLRDVIDRLNETMMGLEQRESSNNKQLNQLKEFAKNPSLTEGQQNIIQSSIGEIENEQTILPEQQEQTANLMKEARMKLLQSRQEAEALFDAEQNYIQEFGDRLSTIDALLSSAYLSNKEENQLRIEQFELSKVQSYERDLQELADFYEKAGSTREEAIAQAKTQLEKLNKIEFDNLKNSLTSLGNVGKEIVGTLSEDLATIDIVGALNGSNSIKDQLLGFLTSIVSSLQQWGAEQFKNGVMSLFFGNKQQNGVTTPSSSQNSGVGGAVAGIAGAALGAYTGGTGAVIGSIISSIFAAGGEVGNTNPTMDLGQAMKKERQLSGKTPRIGIMHEGEQVLSTLNGDASFFRAIKKDGIWDNLKANYAYGGTVGNAATSPIMNSSSSSSSRTVVNNVSNMFNISATTEEVVEKSQDQLNRAKERLLT